MISRFFKQASSWTNQHWVEFFATGAILLLMIIVLWPLIVYTVPPGSVGVMWYRFFGGTVTTKGSELREGIHFILPWDRIYMYDARLQRINESVQGLSVDGLEITVNLSSRYVINSQYAGFLHKSIGPNYSETLMRPQLRTLILTYISENEASDLYSTRRERVQTIVQTRFQSKLANISSNVPFEEAYVNLEDVLIEEITLPSFVRAAIEQKERVRHMSEAYDFRLQLEEKERQRKRIEAEGIRSFQEIVAPGITDSYLRWRGIEATLQLAQSNNAKVIVIGGADGLPIILNTDPAMKGADINSKDAVSDEFGPRSDLMKSPSLAGPAPLTASGAAIQKDAMTPAGTPTVPQPGSPNAAHQAGSSTSSVNGQPGTNPAADQTIQNWMDKFTGAAGRDAEPPKTVN